MLRSLRPLERLRGLLGPDPADARQSLVALGLNSTTSLVAGAFLGAITSTFEELPGLLVLVPAAIGLRGNIFGALGNRLSTSIHTGAFRFSARPDTTLGQNVLAALILTLGMSFLLAVVAKVIAVVLGLEHTISLADLAVISVVGGLLGSVVVLAATLGLAGGAVRYGWDLDNVTAPLVSTLGDVLTLPALFAATFLVGIHVVTPTLALVVGVAAAVALVVGWQAHMPELRRIVRESVPILLLAAAISGMAGISIEKQFESFRTYPALLVLVPAFLSSAGALGGVLSSRLASKLHLGLVAPQPVPGRSARADMAFVFVLGAPVFLFNAVGAHLVGEGLGQASPGLGSVVLVSMLGGLLAMAFVVAISYYGTVVAVRLGLDPDTYGIPVVTSSVDFVGAFALILAIVALGIA